jgi:hypothetical protein
MGKMSWSDIPSLGSLEVDWGYSPENPLGKRACARISNIDLNRLLGEKFIPIKIASKTFNHQGNLLDICPDGLALLVDRKIQEGVLVNVGFFLGKYKVTSRAVVRNSIDFEDRYRVGVKFLALQETHAVFIKGMHASKVYGH